MSHATFGKWLSAIEERRRLNNQDFDAKWGIAGLAARKTNDDLVADTIFLAGEGYTDQEIADLLGCSIFVVEEISERVKEVK